MTAQEFGPYLESLVRGYAADNVRSGRWTADESMAASRKETDRLLPMGLASPGQFLFTVRDAGPAGGRVGILWLHTEGAKSFVYDIHIDEDFQGKGFGRATMLEAEREARRRGASVLGLHVFGHNIRARALYQSLGYHETSVAMEKSLQG